MMKSDGLCKKTYGVFLWFLVMCFALFACCMWDSLLFILFSTHFEINHFNNMNIPSFLISDKVPVLSESTNNNIFKIAHVSKHFINKTCYCKFSFLFSWALGLSKSISSTKVRAQLTHFSFSKFNVHECLSFKMCTLWREKKRIQEIPNRLLHNSYL